MLGQKTLRCDQTIPVSVSWPRSGVCHIFHSLLLGSFCKHPHWWHGPCMRFSVTFGSISFHRPTFFSLTLLSRAKTHRHTEIWIWHWMSESVSLLIYEICCYLSIVASALSKLWWLVQSLREPLVLSRHLRIAQKNLYLPLDAIGAVYR